MAALLLFLLFLIILSIFMQRSASSNRPQLQKIAGQTLRFNQSSNLLEKTATQPVNMNDQPNQTADLITNNIPEVTEVVEDTVIPVVQEEIVIEKKQVAKAKVRINKRVETYDVPVETSTIHHTILVEYIPVHRLLGETEEIPTIREEGNILTIPILEEVIVTEKILRLREEVQVLKEKTTETFTETVVLRREIVDIERINCDEIIPPSPETSPDNNPVTESTSTAEPEPLPNYEEEMIIPVVIEELHIEKGQRLRGKVVVHKRVETVEEVINEPVTKEKIDIKRNPLHQIIEDIIPQVQYQEEALILPLIEEEIVINKRLLWVEDVRISPQEVTENQTQTVTLRREVVTIERFNLEETPANEG